MAHACIKWLAGGYTIWLAMYHVQYLNSSSFFCVQRATSLAQYIYIRYISIYVYLYVPK
jgi:hypothetical protein